MALRLKSATGLLVILLIAFGFQLVAVLSVPVTKTISLGSYENHKFGVFGYCNTKDDTCSGASVGYNLVDSDGFSLPSNARHTLSNLLIVHPIACGFTLILTILAMLAHFRGPSGSSKYLLFCLVFSLPTFLLVLLSFLVDILLFVPHLDWGGWIVLAATILVAISGIVLCIMRRTLSSKKAMKKHQLDVSNELSAFSSNKPLNSFTYSAKDNLPQFTELRYETSHDTTQEEDAVPLTSNIYDQTSMNAADTSYASQGTNNSQVNLLTTEEPPRVAETARYTPDRYDLGPGGPGRPPTGSRGVPKNYPNARNGPNYGNPNNIRNNPNYGYNRPPRSSPYNASITPPSNLQTATKGPMQLPAGTYLPGEEPTSSPDTYGPGVVPLPEIRNGTEQAPEPTQSTDSLPSSVSRPYRGNYRRGSNDDDSARDYEYVPPRQQWNLTEETHERNNSVGEGNNSIGEGNNSVSESPQPPAIVTPSNSGQLTKDNSWYSPAVDEQFRNSYIPDAPVSPSESVSSNFTSVSQRGINPRYFGQEGQQPPGGFHQGVPPPPHMRGPPPQMSGLMGPPIPMSGRPPYGGPGPVHNDKHELLLSGNPDFQFQPRTRRKPGNPSVTPASLRDNSGPYGMR